MRNFFDWQRRALLPLLVWGAGSVVVGAGAARSRDKAIQQAAWQTTVWGAVDLVIALLGRRGAARKAAQLAAGTLDAAAVGRERRRFRQVLLVNAALDVGYVVVGAEVILRARGRAQRRGIGWGVLVQGLFLLGYDSALAWLVGAELGD